MGTQKQKQNKQYQHEATHLGTSTRAASTPTGIAKDKPDRINGNRDQWHWKSKINTETFREESQNLGNVSSPPTRTCHGQCNMVQQCQTTLTITNPM
jgi:hypothetical protein